MSVSETLKTRIGIKKFILPTGNEENAVLAFEYTDKKTEVHLLKVNETKYNYMCILGHRLSILRQGCQTGRDDERVPTLENMYVTPNIFGVEKRQEQ